MVIFGSSVHLFLTESIFTKGKNPARSVHVLKVAREVGKWGNWVEVAEHSFGQFVSICRLPNHGKRKVAAHKLKLGK